MTQVSSASTYIASSGGRDKIMPKRHTAVMCATSLGLHVPRGIASRWWGDSGNLYEPRGGVPY